MTAGVPEPGDVITIRWPDGPYDFTMVFECLEETIGPHEPGWLWLHGCVGETKGKYFTNKDWRTLYARPVEGEPGVYEMVRKPGG